MNPVIYTIGHSNQTRERFLDLLREHGIQTVIDVRRWPVSRHAPHFNRRALAAWLATEGVRYLFGGEELGGKLQELAAYFSDGSLDAAWLKSRSGFREGLNLVLAEAQQGRVCLLCSEGDPARCHRGTILAPELEARGGRVVHILPDGRLLEHERLQLPGRVRQQRLF